MIRVRFAPSPTGYLHIGGARTAIFNWLFARKQNGKFLLRIEDTDQQRSTQQAVEAIFKGLQWLGLQWDEEPIYQSQRLAAHRAKIQQLLEQKLAYRCFCSAERLADERKKAIAEKKQYVYDRKCLHLSESEISELLLDDMPYTVRFHVSEDKVAIQDLQHGEIKIDGSAIGDFIIQRADGSPVYQFAVVVDDHDMAVTHVIRGDDHLLNTHKQALLFRALGWPLPEYLHIPLIHGADGNRLSKRHGATAVHEYAEKGVLPEALFNFLGLLGWSSGDDREFFSRDELIVHFSVDGLQKGSAVFDEKKLEWMNAKYIAALSESEIFERIQDKIVEADFCDRDFLVEKKADFLKIFALLKPRSKYLVDFLDPLNYFIRDPQEYDEAGTQKLWKNKEVADQICQLQERLRALHDWTEESIEKACRDLASELQISAGKLIQPCRLALTGRTATPGLFEVINILGKETVLRRLSHALVKIEKLHSDWGVV